MAEITYKDGKWFLTHDDEVIMRGKKLTGLKNNYKNQNKTKNFGFDVIHIHHQDGLIEDWNPNIKGKRGRKAKKSNLNDYVVKKDQINRVIEVIGMEQLQGHSKKGVVLERGNSVTVVEFDSKGIKYTQDFDTKTGIQRTENPYHKWRIA